MLKGKVAIVTGSTSGIGLGIARALAGQGANIVLNGFGDAGEIETIRSEIEREHGVRAVYHGADMAKRRRSRGMVAATGDELGGVDILVNNAGIQHVAPVEEFPAEKWDAIIAINLSAAFHAIARRGAAMKRARLGPHRQHRLGPRPGRLGAQGGLRRGQARAGRADQGGRRSRPPQRRHLQRDLPGLGAARRWSRSRSRRRGREGHQPATQATADAAGREAAVA